MSSDEKILSHLFLSHFSHLFCQVGIAEQENDPFGSLLDGADEKTGDAILDL